MVGIPGSVYQAVYTRLYTRLYTPGYIHQGDIPPYYTLPGTPTMHPAAADVIHALTVTCGGEEKRPWAQ